MNDNEQKMDPGNSVLETSSQRLPHLLGCIMHYEVPLWRHGTVLWKVESRQIDGDSAQSVHLASGYFRDPSSMYCMDLALCCLVDLWWEICLSHVTC